uniref:Uncharacterized protein n=1 Tax=Knipowitschia caucasica TaxID=637954 RepID=A0AAV2JTR5_KNICA
MERFQSKEQPEEVPETSQSWEREEHGVKQEEEPQPVSLPEYFAVCVKKEEEPYEAEEEEPQGETDRDSEPEEDWSAVARFSEDEDQEPKVQFRTINAAGQSSGLFRQFIVYNVFDISIIPEASRLEFWPIPPQWDETVASVTV